MRITRKFIGRVFIICTLLLVVLVAMVHILFSQMKISNSLPPVSIWAHRGLIDHDSIHENTLASYTNALSRGSQGIECDIYYDEPSGRFIVSHDNPYPVDSARLLYLEQVFERYGDGTFYWLDLKNLSAENKNQLALAMEALVTKYNIVPKVYIETGDLWNSISFSKYKNLQIILWIQNAETPGLRRMLKDFMLQSALLLGDYKGVTRAYIFLDDEFVSSYGHLPVFMFHLNTPAEIKRTAEILPDKKVLLIDSPFYKYPAP